MMKRGRPELNFTSEIILPQGRAPKLGAEDQECIFLVNWLRQQTLMGCMPFIWFKVGNEFDGKKNPIFGHKMNVLGRMKGCADYAFLGTSSCFMIEMKASNGKMSVNQKIFERWCSTLNVKYFLCKSGQDAIEVVKSQF